MSGSVLLEAQMGSMRGRIIKISKAQEEQLEEQLFMPT